MAATQQSSKRVITIPIDWLESHDIMGRIQLPAPPHCDLVTTLTTITLSLVAPALKSADLGSNAAPESVLLYLHNFINPGRHKSIGKLVDISSNLNLLKGPTWALLILDLSLRFARFSISPSGRGHINVINGYFTQSFTPSAAPSPLWETENK